METNSQLSSLEEQIREYYGRVVWTHKTHEKQADIYKGRNEVLKWSQIIVSAFIASGIFVTIFKSAPIVPILTGILSVFQFVLSAYAKTSDFGEVSQLHAKTAIEIWNVRELLLSILIDMKDNRVSLNEAQTMRDDIHKLLYCIYEKAPRTSVRAYNKATKALKDAEEMYFSPEEIDSLLPSTLRRKMP
jgi:hypothetical protein